MPTDTFLELWWRSQTITTTSMFSKQMMHRQWVGGSLVYTLLGFTFPRTDTKTLSSRLLWLGSVYNFGMNLKCYCCTRWKIQLERQLHAIYAVLIRVSRVGTLHLITIHWEWQKMSFKCFAPCLVLAVISNFVVVTISKWMVLYLIGWRIYLIGWWVAAA